MQEKIQAKKQRINGNISVKYFSVKSASIVDENEHVIRVKFAAYGAPDNDRDILIKGCFAKSISERGPESSTNRKIVFLWQHDMRDPIGKILKIEEMEDGAYADIRLSDFDAVPNAKRAYVQLKDGDINQFSFGFEYVWDKLEYDEEQDAFIVKEVKLFEISVVTLGANELTEYVGEIENQADEEIEKALKELSTKNKIKFNTIKSIINRIEAEPEKPLTPKKSVIGRLSKINLEWEN